MVVSLAILIVALVAFAQLLGQGLQSSVSARASSHAAVLAAQKLEALAGAPGPSESPPDCLSRDVVGFVDYLGPDGQPLPSSGGQPRGGLYVRRWSVQPFEGDSGRTLVIEVVAFMSQSGEGGGGSEPAPAGAARLVTLKRRGGL